MPSFSYGILKSAYWAIRLLIYSNLDGLIKPGLFFSCFYGGWKSEFILELQKPIGQQLWD